MHNNGVPVLVSEEDDFFVLLRRQSVRILYISPVIEEGKPTGGIANWTKNVIKSKYLEGHLVDVVNTALIGNRAKNLYRKNLFEELRRSAAIFKDTRSKTRRLNPDIVHMNCSGSKGGIARGIFCAMIVRRSRVIVQFHCDIPYQVNSKVARVLLKILIRNVDEVLTLNRSSSSYLTDICGIESRIIPNFLPDEALNRLCSNRKISDEVSTVIFVGHITKAKGCDIILELAILNSDIEFRLLGHISPDFKDIKLPKNVSILGEGNEKKVLEELEKADVFLFPSRTEGFPIALLEAMACGLPVIASAVGAIPDMLEGKGGITIREISVRNFNDALKSVLEDKEERKRMSEWNKEKATNEFSEEKVLEKLLSIYSDTRK